jgi:hypothetical protein
MNIVWSILSCIFILYVWIWIINTVFSDKKIQLRLSIKIAIIGVVLVGWLFAYKYILQSLGYPNLYFVDNLDAKTVMLFVGYCTAISLLISLFLKNRSKKIFSLLIVSSLFFIAIARWGYLLGMNVLLIYYIVSAYSEEYLKYNGSNNIFLTENEYMNNTKNLLFFCVLTWLGFSVVENVLYLVTLILKQQEINIVWFILGRWLLSSLVHVVATGLIWFITTSLLNKKNWIIITVLWILGWFAVHSIYNISLQYQLTGITIALAILLFFGLSFFLFKSDILYQPKQAQ